MKSYIQFAAVFFFILAFGQAKAQHDSLSCRLALDNMLNQKMEMQALLEYVEQEFYRKLPLYTRQFNAFLDSINHYDLWKYIPDPLELRIEKVRLEFYNDPTPNKRGTLSALEEIVPELKTSIHKVEFAEFCSYLGAIYFQKGQIEKNVSLYRDAIKALEESRKENEPFSILEWMIRTKLANLLCKSDPSGALGCIEMISFLDMNNYQNYAVNRWRKERLENTVSSAWEALGNVYSCLGDAQSAVNAFRCALKYTQPARTTWDSAVLSLVNVQSGQGDSTEVRRLIAWVQKEKPQNSSSICLIAGYAFYMKRNLKLASEFYKNAFESLKGSPKDEQAKILSNLVNVYSEMHADDLVYKTLNVLLKDPSFMKEDDLAYQYSKVSIDIGIQIKKQKGSYNDYFKEAEKILDQKAFGRDFIRDKYAGTFLVLLSRLYISRQGRGDLEKAESVLAQIIDGYSGAAKKLNLRGEYGSDDVVDAKLSLAKIHEIKNDLAQAIDSYKELVSDYSSQQNRGTLVFHNSTNGVDSSAASLFRISDDYLKEKSFEKSLSLCVWMSQQNNLPDGLKEMAVYRTGRIYYYWGFLDRTKFRQALVVFSGISSKSSCRLESEFLNSLCKWYLDFKQAATDELLTLFTNLQSSADVQDKLVVFLVNENILGYSRVISETVFMQGNSGKAQSLLEAVLAVISKNKIDTPEEAKAIYALAKFFMYNGLPKEEKLKKVGSLLEAFFQHKYATTDLWTYFRAGELKMDLDFELGLLSSAAIQQQIEQLQRFSISKEELRRIVDSRNFYKGPGLVSLENLDMVGLNEKINELLAKCYYMLGRVNGQEHRWKEALGAYDVVLDKYTRFDLYVSRSLYYKGLIYLTSLNRIYKAVELFIQLFNRYDDTTITLQAKEDLREAGRIASQPQDISIWFHASKRMFEVSKENNLSKFAIDLAFYLAERHIGEDESYTKDRMVMSAVIKGFGWVALLQDTNRIEIDNIAKANLLLARAYRLESDLKPGSFLWRYGVTYPGKNADKENKCYRRVMGLLKNSYFYEEAQWRLTVNLALMGRPEESKNTAWIYPAFEHPNSSLREQYKKEIGVLIAYMAPMKTKAYNKDVQIAVQNIVDETQANGLFPYLENFFHTTREQVEILKQKTGRSDIKPELLDPNNYPNGK
jgi:hypothetical protein